MLELIRSQVSDPAKFRRLNGWATLFWIAMFPVSILTGLLSSVVYISLLSLYALFATHLGAWAASRTEARQVEDAEIQAEHADVKADSVSVSRDDG